MNISRFTQKSQEVIQLCEKTAMDYGHQEIAQEHLLYSMMNVDESLIRKLIEKMGIEPDVFTTQVESLLQKRPKVTGGELHIDQKLNETLIYAEDEAKRMGDEYVSVEHLFLSLPCPSKQRDQGIDERIAILTETVSCRCFQKYVVTRELRRDNPEATYDTLEKYGSDLVERAQRRKA